MSPAPDPSRRRAVVALGVTLAAGLLGAAARAATVDAQAPAVEFDADGVYASCTVVFALPRALEDALHRGIPLYFLTRLSVQRGRWWWFAQTIGSAEVLTRLSYQPLLDKFHVSTAGVQHSYPTLDEALNSVQHVLHLKVADARDLEAGQGYQLVGSFELDLSQLPRPFQLNVGTSSDWQLQADFPRTVFTWKPPPPTASHG